MRPPLFAPALLLAAAAPCLAAGPTEAGRGDAPADRSAARTAAKVDAVVNEYLRDEHASPAPAASDEDLLRRLTLDVAGRLPSPDELAEFEAVSRSPADRRAAALDHLLSDPGYAANWAAYWRDVIFKRATDQRAARGDHVFTAWMTERLAEGRGWDAVATDLLTATGPVNENGATGLIFAQSASGGEVAAEASRILLGVQIQCAECHDHPYDRWSREDFHTLAAYFPRIRVQRVYEPGEKNKKGPRTFAVVANDRAFDRDRAEKRVRLLREALVRRFKFADGDGDGRLDAAELKKTPAARQADRVLNLGDADGDGGLSPAEVKKLEIPPIVLAGNRSTEHFMPDLENPEAPGTLTNPRFFLTGDELRDGLPDARRRSAAARAITDNEWFAKATVNRVWTELIGDGFYTPVDDIGPDRSVRLEPALEALSAGFVASGHDLRWLVRTVCLTDAYARSLDDAAAPFASAKPARLRARQIYNSVAQVAGQGDAAAGDEVLSAVAGRGRRGRGGKNDPYGRPRGVEQLVEATFGYDPSTAREDLTGDVPQALFLMNGPLSARLTSATGTTPLARLLYQNPSDVHAVRALYRLVLVRDPSAAEREAAVAHVDGAAGRAAGFEDLMWALLNSAEFVTKR